MLIDRLSKITLNSANPVALAPFYVEALGFSRLSSVQDIDPERRATHLALGPTRLDLVDVGQSGRPYPDDVPAWSALFQHCAIRTNDIATAIARLEQIGRFKPISTDGPQRLPQASGGVTAYKFRDPEGHPLELISFPEPNDSAKSHAYAAIVYVHRSLGDLRRRQQTQRRLL